MRKSIPAFFLVAALGSLLLFAHPAFPCGMITHNEVTQRAVMTFASEAYPDYERLVRQYPEAIQPGAVFPDFGYSFGLPDESEDAHWPPFLKAFAAHIHDHYPRPWDEDTERLAVFLLGEASHSLADIDWHSLGVSEGFIEAMAQQDFNGDWGASHSLADMADEALCGYQLPPFPLTNRWYVPTDDLAEVFHDQGFPDITPDDIRVRMAIMFIGSWADRFALKYTYGYYSKPSPFMWEQFKDYFVGGLDSMAGRVSWYWADVIDWIENGPPPDDGGKHPAYAFHEEADAWIFANIDLLQSFHYTFTERRTAKGVMFEIRYDEKAAGASGAANASASLPSDADRSIDFRGETPYEYIGSSLAVGDFNQDGVDDLAIGAPGYWEKGRAQAGAVYLTYGRPSWNGGGHMVSDLGGTAALKGADVFGRFGWALATVDLNADGVDDLAVAAPTTGAPDMQFRGKVFVFFGNLATKALSETPDLVIETDADYTNLGYSLAGGDADGDGFADLLIGAPFAREGGVQKGLAALFLSGRNPSSGTTWTLADADWSASGENDYDWFGYTVGIAPAPEGKTLLLVGAPTYKTGGSQGVGRLYGFAPDGTGLFSITGAAQFDKTGQSYAVGAPYGDGVRCLALGSPTRTNGSKFYGGEIAIVGLDDLSGDLTMGDLDPITVMRGSESINRFGWRVVFADFNGDGVDDLIATRPWADEEDGEAFLWLGGSVPRGTTDAPADSAFWTLTEGLAHSFYGSATAFPDFDGDGSADLAFGAPSSSMGPTLGGNVSLVFAPAPRIDSVSSQTPPLYDQTGMTIHGRRFYQERLELTAQSGDAVLPVSAMTVVDPETIEFTLDVPDNAPTDAYDLTVKTVYGSFTLKDAFLVKKAPKESDESDKDGACGW